MTASVATAAKGTLLGRSTTDGGTYTTISEITGVGGPNCTRDFIDVTHMESTGDYREWITSLIDGGELTLQANHLPGTSAQNVIKDDFNAGTKLYWQITWTDASSTKTRFAGYVSNLGHDSQVGGKADFTFGLKITGEIDWVYTA